MKKNNKNKLKLSERVVAKTLNPIIDKLLRATYHYYNVNNNDLPFSEVDYDNYCINIKQLLESGDYYR